MRIPALLAFVITLVAAPSVAQVKVAPPPERVPAGFHVEERGRQSEVTWGSILVGAGLLAGAASAFSLAAGESVRAGGDAAMLLLGCGVGLAVGVPLLVHGLVAPPKKVLVRDASRVFVVPIVAQNTLGSALAIRF